MPNPNVPQGTLNRLRASVTIPGFPSLNVTAPFLGKEGIRMAFDGGSVTYIDTMTGGVTSPEPYIKVTVTMHLLKTQNLATLYKAQMESLATIGDITVRPDATPLAPYNIVNASIQRPNDLDFSGPSDAFPIVLGGYYPINNSLYG